MLGVTAVGLLLRFVVDLPGRLVANWLEGHREERLRKTALWDIDRMSGEDFERRIAVLLKDMGYRVRRTPLTGDYGADLIAENRQGARCVVQTKRYGRGRTVGVRAVQEVVAAMRYYQAQQAWVVTNSFFTEQARTLADANGVTLIDRRGLRRLLEGQGVRPAGPDPDG